jgi:hypothetical protein
MKASRPSGKTPKGIPSPAVALEVVRDWDLVRSRLAPIIGEDGFKILYARSLHRARAEHPWLAREAVASDNPFSSLRASLASQSPEQAALGSRSHAAQFHDLLHALIGKELADRLLADPIAFSPPRTKPEIEP